MREEIVARRYAAALFTQALRNGVLDDQSADLSAAANLIAANGQFTALLNQPLVTEARKKKAINQALTGKVQAPTLAFLGLLVDKRRIGILPEIEAEFRRLVREQNRVASATAVSATPLTPDQLAALEKSLEARTGKDIELTTEVDPSLIGGVLIRLGDTILDGSVRGNLDRLREQLLTRK